MKLDKGFWIQGALIVFAVVGICVGNFFLTRYTTTLLATHREVPVRHRKAQDPRCEYLPLLPICCDTINTRDSE